jgi:hypothetical protein
MSEQWERGEHPAQAEVHEPLNHWDTEIEANNPNFPEEPGDGKECVVTLRYMVPVDVIVNLDEERVTRVVILDEEARLNLHITQDDDAVRIAEVADWPEWENGY